MKLCYERFGVPVCKINPMGKTAYENTPEGLAQLDRTIAKNHIGEIINLSQFLNCLFWDRLMSDEPFDSLMPLYREICKLAVLSGMEIDKAKRMYDVNADKVLRLLEKPRIEFKKKNGGKLPNFFYFMVGQESNVSPDNKATMKTPMAYLYDAVENLDRKQRENRRIKLSELFELNTADADSNDSKRKRKIIETVLAAYDELKHLKIKEDEADSDGDTVIAVKRAEIFKNCLDTVNPSRAYRQLKKLLEVGGLPSIRFHDLRHTFTSHAANSGIAPKTLSEIVGHTKASFTLDHYAHVTSDMQKNAANIVTNYITDILGKELKPW